MSESNNYLAFSKNVILIHLERFLTGSFNIPDLGMGIASRWL